MSNSVEFWYFRISLNAFAPGLNLLFFGFISFNFPGRTGGAFIATGLSEVPLSKLEFFPLNYRYLEQFLKQRNRNKHDEKMKIRINTHK